MTFLFKISITVFYVRDKALTFMFCFYFKTIFCYFKCFILLTVINLLSMVELKVCDFFTVKFLPVVDKKKSITINGTIVKSSRDLLVNHLTVMNLSGKQ